MEDKKGLSKKHIIIDLIEEKVKTAIKDNSCLRTEIKMCRVGFKKDIATNLGRPMKYPIIFFASIINFDFFIFMLMLIF